MKKLNLLLALLCFTVLPMIPQQAQEVSNDDIVGSWFNEAKDSIIVFKVNDNYFAKYAKLAIPDDPEGSGIPKVDKRNPDPNLRDRKILGLSFLKDCKFEDRKWKGEKLYSYPIGETYDFEMEFHSKEQDTLFIIYDSGTKTSHWTKKDN